MKIQIKQKQKKREKESFVCVKKQTQQILKVNV